MEPWPGSRIIEKTGGEVPQKLALTTSGLPPPPPCRRRLPGSLEKGTEIRAGFLTLIWVEGEGWGVSTSQAQLRPHPVASGAPTKHTLPKGDLWPHI